MRSLWLCLWVLLHLSSTAQHTGEILYHVMQRSFYDSNGDLHGDLNGLREKLDYLQELGITSILLLPLYHSEYYHNYFATDFETIDPEFGTMDDYLALVREVHARGMKIYLDMETQYITEDHLWYRDSYQNPDSPYSDYLLYNGPGNTEPESIIWDLTELTGYDGTTRKVTTVNLLHPAVLDYNIHLFRYWVDPNGDGNFDDGVDGFRLDHMMDDLDWKGKLPGLFENFWKPLIASLKQLNPSLTFIAEQAKWETYGNAYRAQAGVDRVFGFNLYFAMSAFDKTRILRAADSTFSTAGSGRDCIVFIENHDIRRYASAVDQDPGKLKVGAALNLLIGGTPSIYYGQELGMTGAGGFGKFGNTDANDIPMREAFEWYRQRETQGMALWYKDSGPWWEQSNLVDNDGISLEEQRDDPHSLWNYYRSLIALRKKHPALSSGILKALQNKNVSALSFLRKDEVEQIVVIINLSGQHQSTVVDLEGVQISTTPVLTMLHGVGAVTPLAGQLHCQIQPYGVVVLEIH